jgi:hypothetical protein
LQRNINFELSQCKGKLQKQQNEIDGLKNNQKILKAELDELKSEISKLMKKNHILQEKIKQKIKNKTLSCLQEVEFTDENIAKVREMSAFMTKEQIARRFNMSLTTYLKREEKIPELKKAFEVGLATFMEEATSIAVKHIRSGCRPTLFYFFNNKMKLKQDQEETAITITQRFLDRPLKIVSGSGNYEEELMDKYRKKIASITLVESNSSSDG